MNNILKKTVLMTLIIITLSGVIKSQQQDEFLIGTFIHSSDDLEITQYNNYNQIHEMGANSVLQIAVKPLYGGQISNLDLLSGFNYVYVANDSGLRLNSNEIGAVRPENTDWIAYFTQAKYRRWEAEGDSLFSFNTKIKHEFGGSYSEADTIGWRSGYEAEHIGKLLVTGPDYWQYPRYTWTNVTYNREIINYNAVFRMKIDYPSEEVIPICEIYVTQSILEGDTWRLRDTLHLPEFPKIRTLTTADLNTYYQEIVIPYNYSEFLREVNPEQVYLSSPGGMMANLDEGPGYNINSKVQFNVKWLGSRELFVDYVEVYDDRIYEYYFKRYPDTLITKINLYDQSFKIDTNFYSKLFYYLTQDEPHSIDCYHALKEVQSILDAQQIKADLLSHWYPEWNGKWLGKSYEDHTWPFYGSLAQPKKVMFWYAPFGVTEGVDDDNNFTLYFLQLNLQWAHLVQPDMFVTLQAWGSKDSNNTYPKYRRPTPEEIGAETMLSLAHGVKGIFYEHYYSYSSTEFNEGLVGTISQGYPRTDNWFKVQEIATRLGGDLGNTLMTLKYDANSETSGYLSLRRKIHEETNESVTYQYLTLSSINNESQPEKSNFHAGFFNDSTYNGDKYFLLANLLTTDDREVRVGINNNFSVYKNIRLTNVESENNFDFSFYNSIIFDQTINAGDGYLFKLSPIVKSGGTLAVNDTITSNISLEDNLTISNGVNLVISNSIYTLKDTVTLQGAGMITGSGYMKIESAGRININSFSRGLFKSVAGANPKLFWYFPPEFSSVEKFKIYRQLESNSLELIAQVDGETFEYVDEEITVFIGQTPPNESYVEYYVQAVGLIDEEYQTSISTNVVRYRMDRDMQKQVSGDENKVKEYELSNNYPNPFNPTTRIKYAIPKAGQVTIIVFDILGNEVKTLVNETKDEGRYEISFDASNLSSGIYFYELTSGKFTSRKKMLVLK